jgi:hypothetical protein
MINNRIVLALANGYVVTYDAKTGAEISRFDTDEELNGAPIAAAGRVILVTTNAKLIVYK